MSDGAFGSSALGRVPALDGIRLSYVPIGEAADNVAITSFSVRR